MKTTLTIVMVCFFMQTNLFAYKVFMGLHCTPQSAAEIRSSWDLTASKIEGINATLAPCDPTPGTVNANDVPCTLADWKTVIATCANHQNAIIEIPRSVFGPTGPHASKSIQDVLASEFSKASTYGYGISRIMFYDNATGSPLVYYNWTISEVQAIRYWLNNHNHSGVKILYDARNNSSTVRNWCTNSLVQEVLLEMSYDAWVTNLGSRHELVKWLYTSTSKNLIFQVVTSANDPYNGTTAYQDVRNLVRSIQSYVGAGFNASYRVTYMPVTYNKTTFRFSPETLNGYYVNSLTGLTLSLIEQEAMFCKGATVAQCNSYVRTAKSGVLDSNSFTTQQPTVSIVPNPASDIIYVSLSGINNPKIEIINTKGVVVYQNNSVNSNELSINTTEIKGKGTCFVKVTGTNASKTEKILIK